MPRISKNPTVRKRELVEIAEELFLKKGFSNTSISDIVKMAGVAQGTFYYYFKTKDDMLDAITGKYVRSIEKVVGKVLEEEDMNAVEKLIKIVSNSIGFGPSREKMEKYVSEEKNARLHYRIKRGVLSSILPIIEEIIQQGIEEDLFNTDYPRESAMLLVTTSGLLFDSENYFGRSLGEKSKTIMASIYLFERILGTKPGIFGKHALSVLL